MKFGNLMIWMDEGCLRTSNLQTGSQPVEISTTKYWRIPGIKFYEDEAERGGGEIRMGLDFFWASLNMVVWYTKKGVDMWDDKARTWGLHFMDRNQLVMQWGKWYKSWNFPFITTVYIKTDILSMDRKHVRFTEEKGTGGWENRKEAVKENCSVFPYRYELLNGDVQNVLATVHVCRWTRRWKWTPFLDVSESIDINFSEGVGPGRGSWKGRVTGVSFELKKGETAIQCLRRMERDRRFER